LRIRWREGTRWCICVCVAFDCFRYNGGRDLESRVQWSLLSEHEYLSNVRVYWRYLHHLPVRSFLKFDYFFRLPWKVVPDSQCGWVEVPMCCLQVQTGREARIYPPVHLRSNSSSPFQLFRTGLYSRKSDPHVGTIEYVEYHDFAHAHLRYVSDDLPPF